MPSAVQQKASSTVKTTNKTEFQRYLNVHPDAVIALRTISAVYAANPHGKHTFGFWLRVKYRAKFDAAYARWWMKRPDLYGKVYDEAEVEEFAGTYAIQ